MPVTYGLSTARAGASFGSGQPTDEDFNLRNTASWSLRPATMMASSSQAAQSRPVAMLVRVVSARPGRGLSSVATCRGRRPAATVPRVAAAYRGGELPTMIEFLESRATARCRLAELCGMCRVGRVPSSSTRRLSPRSIPNVDELAQSPHSNNSPEPSFMRRRRA